MIRVSIHLECVRYFRHTDGSEAAIILLALVMDSFSGVFIAIPPVFFVGLVKDKTRIGKRVCIGYGIIALNVLVGGSDGGGGILGHNDLLNVAGLWSFGSVLTRVVGVMYAGLPVVRDRFKLSVKA